jgi:hypothetical protein
MKEAGKTRIQAYLDKNLAELVRERAKAGRRPDSWEFEYLLRKGLEAEEAG